MKKLLVLLIVLAGCSTPTASVPVVRLVTFGDSHVDYGLIGDSIAEVSYISNNVLHVKTISSHSAHSLAGKVEALSDNTLRFQTVNHGIAGTSSDATFRGDGEPNALAVHKTLTRFEAEVLGTDPSWDGGTGKKRTAVLKPDFVYVSIGTNDPSLYLDSAQSLSNIRKMIQLWTQAGLPVSHFIIGTIPPNVPSMVNFPGKLTEINEGIRKLEGVTVIDVHLKTAVGEDWIPGLTKDGIHYNEPINNWLASLIAAKMRELKQ